MTIAPIEAALAGETVGLDPKDESGISSEYYMNTLETTMTPNETSPDQAVEAVAVTQADRDAAASYLAWDYGAGVSDDLIASIRDGRTYVELIEAFARHRLSAIPTPPPADHTDLIARLVAFADYWRSKAELPGEVEAFVKAADALQAQASPREWQDIATAPHEGRVLVVGGRYSQAEIVEADGPWWNTPANAGLKSIPTHWMPVPSFARTALELG